MQKDDNQVNSTENLLENLLVSKMTSTYQGTEDIIGGTQVTIKNHDGSILGQFIADYQSSILDQAEVNNIDIGYSCRSGACYACACKVEAGGEGLDIGKYGIPLVDLEEQDVLTCVAGLDEIQRVDQIILRRFY